MQLARTRLTVEAGALLFLLVLILLAEPAVQGQRRPRQPPPGVSEYRNTAFAGVAGNNLVHHRTLCPDGVGFKARRVAGEMAQPLTVRPPFGVAQALPRSAIARMQALEQSMMPEGLEEGLSLQDMAGLLQFISGS